LANIVRWIFNYQLFVVHLAQSYEYRPYYRVYHTIYFSVNYSASAPAKQFCILLNRWNGIQCV